MSKKPTSKQAKLFRTAGILFGLISLGLLAFNLWRGGEGVVLYLTNIAMLVAAIGLYGIGKRAAVVESDGAV